MYRRAFSGKNKIHDIDTYKKVMCVTHHQLTSTPRLALFLVAAWALVSTIVGMSHVALEPIPNDGALYAYISHLWLHGQIPYLNVWENKPPGVFALGALVFWIFPTSLTVLVIVEGVFILSSILVVVLLLRQLGGTWFSSCLGGICASIACNLIFYHDSNNLPEVYLILPATLSMYFFAKSGFSLKGRWIFIAGVFSGVASIFKPTGLTPYLAQIAFLFLAWTVFNKIDWKTFLSSTITNSLGVGLAWLPCVIYFSKYEVLLELLDASLLYNVKYGVASQKPFYVIPFDTIENIQLISSLVVCALGGLVIFLLHQFLKSTKGEAQDNAESAIFFFLPLVLIWNFGDLCGALAGGRNYTHYFLPLTASLSVTAGMVYALVMDRVSIGLRFSGLRAFIICLLVGPLLFSQITDFGALGRVIMNPPSFTYAWKAVAEQIKIRRVPGDTLFTWDYLPALYFETKMESPSRNLDARHLDVWPEQVNQEQSDTIWQELWPAMENSPPHFIVDKIKSPLEIQTGGLFYRKFREFVGRNYRMIYENYNLQLYEYSSGLNSNNLKSNFHLMTPG